MQRIVRISLVCLLAATLAGLSASGFSAESDAAGSFRVVVLPDTQLYSEKFPETYETQTRWIRSQAEDGRVVFVIHLGDIVQNAGVEDEWINADRAHRLLDGVVPYSMLPGNHDLDVAEGKLSRQSDLYNKYFGPERFAGCSWYSGHQDETNRNNYCVFEAAGMKFVVLSLEYSPADETLDWAAEVAASHPAHRIIVATHCYMRPNGRDENCRTTKGLEGNSGNDIWEKLVSKQPNIFMVLSGHVAGVGHQTSENEAGRPVHEILVDYQKLPDGGTGWLDVLEFVPEEDVIRVDSYSPLLDQHNPDPEHSYMLEYRMFGHD